MIEGDGSRCIYIYIYSFESSDRDTATASTYRLSCSDGASGKNSITESVKSTNTGTPAVTEVTLEPDMRHKIGAFLSTAPDSLKMDSDQWEGLAASTQGVLSEIKSGDRLKGTDKGIKREVETILETLMMACSVQATESLPVSPRKRERSSDGGSGASSRPSRRITIQSICE
jgi:hypothetical protein